MGIQGGTCLKKCYFETYRFSEDLDFTLTDEAHVDEDFLLTTFREISDWVYDASGIEIPGDRIRFKLTDIRGAGKYAEGRVYYVGPLQQRRNLARVKLDLTSKEKLVLAPELREVHHPYSDRPAAGIRILSYCFEEVFAEKVRALAERERPRDLYDVMRLYRHDEIRPDRSRVTQTLRGKCVFKKIPVPNRESLIRPDAREKLAAEWEAMLAHQLPVLPPFEQFWGELPQVLDWLSEVAEKPVLSAMSVRETIDESWQPPAMVQAWHSTVPLESIRFAAANRLCVNLQYQNSWRLIEPYSLRRSRDGNLLLYAVRRESGEVRAYRVDRIQAVEISELPFVPRYPVELTPAGALYAPENQPSLRATGSPGSSRQRKRGKTTRSSGGGPTYIFRCATCGKRFRRKSYDATFKSHKNKQGYPCYGSFGAYVRTEC